MQKEICDAQEAKGKYRQTRSARWSSFHSWAVQCLFIFNSVVSTKRGMETTGDDATYIPKSKRPRITFTQDQMAKLLSLFKTDKYPDLFMQRDIAESLGLTPTNVYVSA